VSRTTDWSIDTLNEGENMVIPDDLPEYFLVPDLDTRQRELADLGLWVLQVIEEECYLQKPIELSHGDIQGVLRPILHDAERLGLIVKASSLVD